MSYPLVSIICLCYNHERFLREALDSVLAQTYPNLEIIIVDDSSTDSSPAIISEYCKAYPAITCISTGTNIGNCAAFNKGWRSSKGDFIIDFATDDVLFPKRVAQQVAAFQMLDETYGVVYSDALYIDDHSNPVRTHYKHDSQGLLVSFAPSGNLFKDLLSRYFICPPTMMMRRRVFEKLDGYDETLAYEDFDFWVRSSRYFKYSFLDAITTKRRLHDTSLSKGFYKPGNRLLQSTLRVCEKAAKLIQNREEEKALVTRLQYEARHAYHTGNYEETNLFLSLLRELKVLSINYKLLGWLSANKVDMQFIRTLYYRLRYKE